MTSTELKHQAKLQNWAVAIQDCRSSGLCVRQWCRERGITTTTYYRWEREVLALAKVTSNRPIYMASMLGYSNTHYHEGREKAIHQHH